MTYGVNKGIYQPFLSQRLQNGSSHLQSQVMAEFGDKKGKSLDANKSNLVTAFAAPGANSADFEEMTFMLQKTVASQNKALRKRNISSLEGLEMAYGEKNGSGQRIADIQKLRKIYEQLDSSYNPHHLKKHAEHLYKLASKGEDFSFTDASLPAGSYIQLKEAEHIAIEEVKKNSDPNAKIAKQIIQNKIADLDENESFSRKVDAGLNTAEIFKNAYGNDASRAKIRAIYYNNIMASSNLGALWQSLINTFGEKGLEDNIDTLSKAVLADINADRPSSNFNLLATQLKDLNRLNTARSAINDCSEFYESMHKKGVIIAPKNNHAALKLTKEILALSNGSIFANDLDRISTLYAGKNEDNKLTFMNALYPFLKSLPEGIWSNDKSRLTGLQTILVHMENEALKLHREPAR